MKTVSNITSAATRTIWGDGTKTNETVGQELVLGEVGDATKSELYNNSNTDKSNFFTLF
jgi:hypothetical protein